MNSIKITHIQAKKQQGFTLIEIMVVIVIIGILATLVVPRIMGRPDEARVVSAKHDVTTLVQALKLYKLDSGRYPTTQQGLNALVTKPTTDPAPMNWKMGGYLDKLPQDPWGNPYQYSLAAGNADPIILSLGADAAPGGEGENADIRNTR